MEISTEALWAWFGNEQNQKTLAWILGGSAAVATAIWKALNAIGESRRRSARTAEQKLDNPSPPAYLQALFGSGSAFTSNGGMVAGRDLNISGSVHIGVSAREYIEALKKRETEIREAIRVEGEEANSNQAALKLIMDRLGDTERALGQYEFRLRRAAELIQEYGEKDRERTEKALLHLSEGNTSDAESLLKEIMANLKMRSSIQFSAKSYDHVAKMIEGQRRNKRRANEIAVVLAALAEERGDVETAVKLLWAQTYGETEWSLSEQQFLKAHLRDLGSEESAHLRDLESELKNRKRGPVNKK